jgi:type II secretory pathway component GspD/PulD (secretin)
VRNNEDAVMNVGSRIPIKEERTDADGETTTNIRYEEVGIILTVTPQINLDGDVVLKIKQEVSDVGQEQFGDTGAASFSTREAETSVITQDGYPIVIGGLIQNRDEDIISGVPFFKDLPLLGRLFRYSEKKNRRQDLFILVTPRVIRTPGQGWAVTDNVLEQRVQELEKLFNREGSDTDKLKDFLRNPTLK